MKKLSTILAVVIVCAFMLCIMPFAAEEPANASGDTVYVDFSNGNASNDGTSADKATKTLSAAVGFLPDGGTIVASGKMYIGGTYEVPTLGGTLKITSNDGERNYKNFEPATNPGCAFKMATGATLTFSNDVIIEDIILFQETYANNTIVISNNSTLVIGENVDCIPSPYSEAPCYMAIKVEEGSTAIIKSGTFQRITGNGTVINEGATVIESEEYTLYTASANALYTAGVIDGYSNLEGAIAPSDAAELVEKLTGNAASFDGESVSESEFLTELLTAMGYTDVADVIAFANELGLIDYAAQNENFKRIDAFNICANAFDVAFADGETTSEKLVASGIVSERTLGFAKRIANGEVITVACVGDSITEGVGASPAATYSYPAQLQKLLGDGFDVVNCGKSGAYVMNLESEYNVKAEERPDLYYPATTQYQKLMECDPDVVIVMLGTNDARSMTAMPAEDVFVEDYKALIADIASLESDPEIYLATMIPAVNADMTHQGTYYTLPVCIRNIASELGLPLVDNSETLANYFYAMLPYGDSVHPTNESYPALATNFYNEVFGYEKELPVLENAESGVVYLSSKGAYNNDGATPETAVDTIGVAVAKLMENGGTIVVCDVVDASRTHFAQCAGNVTITSVYGGVDYRKSGAKLTVNGILTFLSDVTFENINIVAPNSGVSINCGYNNFTVGEGVVCTGANPLIINAGYRLASGTITPEMISCSEDCTISIASGTWNYINGGNQRTNSLNQYGTIAEGAKLSVYISGGEFTHVGTINVNTLVGQNSVDGEVYMEISGGKFAGEVCAISRAGSNTTGTTPCINGKVTLKILGGEYNGRIALYQNSDATTVSGESEVMVIRPLADAVTMDGFDNITVLDVFTLFGDANGDGAINLLDVIAVLKHLVDDSVEIYESNSDYDKDGVVTLVDALAIFKKLAN